MPDRKINFRHENGYCPYFTHNETKYYIQDRKVDDVWRYQLRSAPNKAHKETFPDEQSARAYVQWKTQDNKHTEEHVNGGTIYKFKGSTLFHNGKVVVERQDPVELTGWHTSYSECLSESKKIVQRVMDQEESAQLSFLENDMGEMSM